MVSASSPTIVPKAAANQTRSARFSREQAGEAVDAGSPVTTIVLRVGQRGLCDRPPVMARRKRGIGAAQERARQPQPPRVSRDRTVTT